MDFSRPARIIACFELPDSIHFHNISYPNVIAQILGPLTSSHPAQITRSTTHTKFRLKPQTT